MNSEYCKLALAKVGNPSVLINLISRRVRQLNSGGGGINRPLLADVGNMGAGDIALVELIEEKMGFDASSLTKPSSDTTLTRRRKKHQQQQAHR
ncbi:MAG TPA: hypothetical protein DCM86_18535 [Verrucomicrobiales bacterium]|nr:hypothetical protein [Verrucomicrobiales bacterium]